MHELDVKHYIVTALNCLQENLQETPLFEGKNATFLWMYPQIYPLKQTIWLSERLCGDQGPWLERNPSCPLCRDALLGPLHWLHRWIRNLQVDWALWGVCDLLGRF